jgi:LysM repeat protein
MADKPLLKNEIHMKKFILSLLLCISINFAFAQQELMIQSNDKGFYIVHSVQPKESFYSIGRLYNIGPKDMAAFNKLDMNNGLNVGQQIMIPLSANNFTQSASGSIPVYYKVGEKEGLYRVSLKNNNVLMAQLRKYNNLTSDAIAAGQKLVVGYIISDPAAAHDVTATPVTKPEVKSESPVINNDRPTQKPQDATVPTKLEPEKPLNKPVQQPVANQIAVKDANGGYFKLAFEQQSRSLNANKDQTATSGIFKTASGWQDTKYYALMDGVDPGTIVRVINPTNNKAIYAKILGGMSGIRQNAGYDVRISNAAASALDISDTEKFIVRVNY